MIKILLITQYYPSHRGGVEIAAYRTALNILMSELNRIRWIAIEGEELPEKKNHLKFTPIKMYNFIEKFLPFPYPIPAINSIKILKHEVINNELVHIHEFIYLSSLIAFFYAKRYKKKIIITQHIGLIPYKSIIIRNCLKLVNRLLGKYILQRADKVVFISDGVRKYFSNFCKSNNFLLQSNSVNTRQFIIYPETKRNYIEHEMKLKKYNSTILFVGRFTEKKGIPIIIELAKKFQSILWIFVGWGTIDPIQSGLNNILVYRDIENKKVRDFYNIADFLILPSYGEGFPLVIQEAFSCGLPVITTIDNTNGYLDANKYLIALDKDNFKKWVELFDKIDRKSFFYKYSKNDLRHFAIEHWSEEKNGAFYNHLIDELITLKNND